MFKIINSFLWAIATFLIVVMGIYFTFKLRFVQFRFKDIFKNLFKKNDKNTISPFASLMMVLAGRIGVGSVAGIALAIHLGGIGSIFWMWVIGLIAIPLSFAETVLGVKYKEKDGKYYKGGPSYYLKKGLNKQLLGSIYAFLILFSYIGGFLGIQSNTICKSINTIVTIDPLIVGLIISSVTFFTILGGIKKISNVCSKLVPFMTVFYVISAFYILINNINVIPNIFLNIVKSAFDFRSLGAGVLGNMVIGIQRGIFSSEAGLGTGAIAASAAETKNPASQGFVQMVGIYITTFLICTATAIVILTADFPFTFNDINGIEITQNAFTYHFGNFGNIIVFTSIILFAFSTILSGYYDGEASLKYFLGNVKKQHLLLLKMISLIIIFIGAIIPSTSLWTLVDISTALLAIINIYGLFGLKEKVYEELRKYEEYDTM